MEKLFVFYVYNKHSLCVRYIKYIPVVTYSSLFASSDDIGAPSSYSICILLHVGISIRILSKEDSCAFNSTCILLKHVSNILGVASLYLFFDTYVRCDLVINDVMIMMSNPQQECCFLSIQTVVYSASSASLLRPPTNNLLYCFRYPSFYLLLFFLNMIYLSGFPLVL